MSQNAEFVRECGVFIREKRFQKDSFESKAYVTVFNYSGKIVVPRTEVAAVADKAGLAAAGLTTTGYAEGESLKVRDGKLYLGVACRDGSSGNRRANILVYDCVQGE